jgi:hypothetical protein
VAEASLERLHEFDVVGLVRRYTAAIVRRRVFLRESVISIAQGSYGLRSPHPIDIDTIEPVGIHHRKGGIAESLDIGRAPNQVREDVRCWRIVESPSYLLSPLFQISSALNNDQPPMDRKT